VLNTQPQFTGSVVPPQATTPGMSPNQTDPVLARVEPGEGILDKETMDWIGGKGLQAIKDKANKERQAGTQQPQLRRMPPTMDGAPPRFVSPGAIQTMQPQAMGAA
jgi:hypothetical protein